MKKTFLIAMAAGAMMLSCQSPTLSDYNQGVNIIPIPNEMHVDAAGQRFALAKGSAISAQSAESKVIAEFFAGRINSATGYNLQVVDGAADIELRIDGQLNTKAEGYRLSVTEDKVVATGKDKAGLFYAMQSFMQLLPAEIASMDKVSGVEWSAPVVEIKDEPRFGYRGIMLDVCRHFMPVEFIKEQLDIMALFKINRLHWHLTEDQAWRVEIKRYPLLTEVGSKRIEGDGTEYSGFYTQDEIREVVAYAAERQITIIPEFELPGHELAAISAYPELSCKGEPTTPRIVWGVERVVMCPAKPNTFEFIENVIDEMVDLFPGEYFHIGGDECPKVSWANCPACQKFIRENGLQAKGGHSAEERLQSYVVKRAEDMLLARGKKLIGWDEILEGGLSKSATVMSWRGEKGGIKAAQMGNDVIMTPNGSGFYLDYYQGDNAIEPVTIGGDAPLSKMYAYNPIPDVLADANQGQYITGVQANLWTEYQYTEELMEYRIYPRALALAEVAWSNMETRDFEDFSRRVNNGYVRLDSYGVNYHIPQPEQPGGSMNYIAFVDDVDVEFTSSRPVKMVYTLDGAEPTPSSVEYVEPLNFTDDATLKIRSVLPSGKMSPVRTIVVDKQSYAPATTVAEVESGLMMSRTEGAYQNMEQLSESTVKAASPVAINGFKDMVNSLNPGESWRDFVFSANVAEGYIDIAEDGVYDFRTNNNEFWIDGKLLISNDNEVKRFSRKIKSVALAKGLHPIKVVWLGNIYGGWASNRDSGDVTMRKSGSGELVPVAPSQLYRVK